MNQYKDVRSAKERRLSNQKTIQRSQFPKKILRELLNLRRSALESHLVLDLGEIKTTEISLIKSFEQKIEFKHSSHKNSQYIIIIIIIFSVLISAIVVNIVNYMIGIRCFIPNNYLVWEATRPISNCRFCEGIKRPLILQNSTLDEFSVRKLYFSNERLQKITVLLRDKTSVKELIKNIS